MGDVLGVIDSVFGLCGSAASLILSLSRYVDGVRESIKEVQQLSTQLSSTHVVISQLKVVVEQPQNEPYIEKYKPTFELTIKNCDTTFRQIEALLEKSQLTTKQSGRNMVVKSIKWRFNVQEVKKLTKHLEDQMVALSYMHTLFNRYATYARPAVSPQANIH
jgi:hypothetical protein